MVASFKEGKLDLKKELKHLYAPKSATEIIRVPALRFLMIDGSGSTESQPFQAAIQALYSIAYKIKFMVKKQHSMDFSVMPLEGLWWADNMQDFTSGNKSAWKWTLMIAQPDFITIDEFNQARHTVLEKEPGSQAASVRLETFEEGWAAQLLHTGPFSTEGPRIQELHRFIAAQGGVYDGLVHKHHEIYLSNFQRVAPDKMRTILRQSFRHAPAS